MSIKKSYKMDDEKCVEIYKSIVNILNNYMEIKFENGESCGGLVMTMPEEFHRRFSNGCRIKDKWQSILKTTNEPYTVDILETYCGHCDIKIGSCFSIK